MMGSVYHRIMFGMSFFDIVQSLAMAFTTLPMPIDMIYDQFEGLIIGTEDSCKAQGFMYLIGSIAATTYNGMLCLYYLCALHLQLTDEIIKRIEPAFHTLPFLVGLLVASLSLAFDLIKPSPLIPYCMTMPYPYWCTDESDCFLRDGIGSEKSADLLSIATNAFFCLGFLTIIVSLVVVVWSVYKREKMIRTAVNDVTAEVDGRSSSRVQAYRDDLEITKSAMWQSLYYVAALLAVFLVPLIRIFLGGPAVETSRFLQILHVLLRPSQGVFNLLIFVHQKIWALRRRRTHAYLTSRELLIAVVFCGDEAMEMTISSLELVRRQDIINNILAGVVSDTNDDDEMTGSKLGDLPPKPDSIKSGRFSLDSDEGAPSANRDGFSGYGDPTGSRIEGVSYGSSVPEVNVESSWQDNGDLSNVSSIGSDRIDLQG